MFSVKWIYFSFNFSINYSVDCNYGSIKKRVNDKDLKKSICFQILDLDADSLI